MMGAETDRSRALCPLAQPTVPVAAVVRAVVQPWRLPHIPGPRVPARLSPPPQPRVSLVLRVPRGNRVHQSGSEGGQETEKEKMTQRVTGTNIFQYVVNVCANFSRYLQTLTTTRMTFVKWRNRRCYVRHNPREGFNQ